MTRRGRALLAGIALLLLGGCHTFQTALGGQATESRQFIALFTLFLVVTGLVYLLVIGFLVGALARGQRPVEHAEVVESGRHHEEQPGMRTGLIGWMALIATGLSGLAIASFFADRTLARDAASEQLAIEVTGHQWWWDITYQASQPANLVRTANELHLPVGVPVRIRLHSNDVIHSFWVPNLTGKQDLIPGRDTDVSFTPQRIGIYRGQCAEFCGAQHAHMAFSVDVDSRADFDRWYAAELQPVAAPAGPLAQAGYRYVTSRECAMCHTIAGTPAGGGVGPDLTHLASRRSIAAGTLPMSSGNLSAWVADPQSRKPGNHMPTIALAPDQLHAIVAYLEGLK